MPPRVPLALAFSVGAVVACTKPPFVPKEASRESVTTDAGAATAARRLVLGPTEVAVIQAHGGFPPGRLPTQVTLGRSGDLSVALLLRFDVPRDVEVVEAFLVVDRADDGSSDGRGVGLHAEHIAGPWAASTVSWLNGPPLDSPSPSLTLRVGARERLRVDVGYLRGPRTSTAAYDEGVALVADHATINGVPIAVTAGEGSESAPRAPRLELYVK